MIVRRSSRTLWGWAQGTGLGGWWAARWEESSVLSATLRLRKFLQRVGGKPGRQGAAGEGGRPGSQRLLAPSIWRSEDKGPSRERRPGDLQGPTPQNSGRKAPQAESMGCWVGTGLPASPRARVPSRRPAHWHLLCCQGRGPLGLLGPHRASVLLQLRVETWPCLLMPLPSLPRGCWQCSPQGSVDASIWSPTSSLPGHH